MNIELTHKDGGFVKVQFEEFFSEMPSDECKSMLNLLIDEYGMSAESIDEKFKITIEATKLTRKKVHLLNIYRFFRRKYIGVMDNDGVI